MNTRSCRGSCAYVLLLLGTVTGCPGRSSAPTSEAPVPSFVDEVAILKADASPPSVQAALETVALGKGYSASMRLSALRKLEEVGAPATITTAQTIALDPDRSKSADFLRLNAAALLVRHENEENAKAALAQVKASSLDMAVFASRLEREQGGR